MSRPARWTSTPPGNLTADQETVNHKYGNTVILVTHNDAIKQMADRVVQLRDGTVRRNYRNETKVPAAELDW